MTIGPPILDGVAKSHLSDKRVLLKANEQEAVSSYILTNPHDVSPS
jgi:hypothetical protein